MWLISLITAISLTIFTLVVNLIKTKNANFVVRATKRLPCQLIPFFLSMFVIVVALNYQGISLKIADLLGNSNAVWVYGYTSFITSNFINNIPMSILYTGLCSHLDSAIYLKAIYASIIGSNIGAFLTPIGALAGIMFLGLVKEHEVDFTFIEFVKYGSIVALPTLSVALLTLYFL